MKDLTGMSVRRTIHKMFTVEFFSIYPDCDQDVQVLGGCDPNKVDLQPVFPINGAGGERIVSIEVGLKTYAYPDAPAFLRDGRLESFQVRSGFHLTFNAALQPRGFAKEL